MKAYKYLDVEESPKIIHENEKKFEGLRKKIKINFEHGAKGKQ